MDTSKIQTEAEKFINDKHEQLQLDLDNTYQAADDKLVAAIRKIHEEN